MSVLPLPESTLNFVVATEKSPPTPSAPVIAVAPVTPRVPEIVVSPALVTMKFRVEDDPTSS